MTTGKPKLLLLRDVFQFGIFLVWFMAIANALHTFLTTRQLIVASGGLAGAGGELLGGLANQFFSNDAAIGAMYRTLVLHIGFSICVAIALTAVLATAIAVIDLRNMVAMKSERPQGITDLLQEKPEIPSRVPVDRDAIRSKYRY